MKVLVACEFSGVVRDAFAALGHEVMSCDLVPAKIPPTIGDSAHYTGDILRLLARRSDWDLLVAHPPCTCLAASGARWFSSRLVEQEKAIDFFMALVSSSIPQIAIENPVGVMSKRYRKPDQIIQPWMFGHGETKATCLWLKGLPPLQATKLVDGRIPRVHFESAGIRNGLTRQQRRSITYSGIAQAMAVQWGGYV